MSETVSSEILQKIDSLPVISPCATKVLGLMSTSNFDASILEQELRSDPGLTTHVLRIANSTGFNVAGSITSVRDAAVRLGTQRVFELVLATAMNDLMDAPLPGYDAERGELWRHSIAVAIASEAIAKTLGLTGTEKIFTAGLLHDVGKLALGEFLQQKRRRVATAAAKAVPYDAVEREVLGVDHSKVGALILKAWSIPEELVKAVRWHHQPNELEPHSTTVDVVHVADVLSISLGFDEGREGLQYESCPAAMVRLGLQRKTLDAVAIETLEGVAQITGTWV